MIASTGYHDGEIAVQQRAGVRAAAIRLSGMLAPTDLDGGAALFLGQRDLALLTARDRGGELWISPLRGSPGFLDGGDTTLRIHSAPATDDPLAGLPAEQPVGILGIDFPTRRRIRVNGTLTSVSDGTLEVSVEQAYGNCPQYIQQRRFFDHSPSSQASSPTSRSSVTLDAEQTRLIQHADTFFLGTTHPERGADASHRGGTPGFVRVEGADLWWPDYPGNNMFNSLGNLAVDDTAALLFVDFATGATLHLSGTAVVEWTAPGAGGDDGGTGRRVRFTPRHIVGGVDPMFQASDPKPSPRNPQLS